MEGKPGTGSGGVNKARRHGPRRLRVALHGGMFDPAREDRPRIPHHGMFFSDSERVATHYAHGGRITTAVLRLENPFDPENESHVHARWVEEWIGFWDNEDGWIERTSGEQISNYDVKEYLIATGLLPRYDEPRTTRWEDFLATAREHHDGYVGKDPTEIGASEEEPTIFVVFEPEQIQVLAPAKPARRS